MSQNLRLLLLSAALIFLGALVDHFVISKILAEKAAAPVGQSIAAENELAQLKEKLSGITEHEIREYLKGQSADEKLRKADEILAKIVKIFIADLGLRLSPQEIERLGQLPPASATPVDTQPKSAAPMASPSLTPTPPRDLKKRNVDFNLITTPEQEKEFLKNVATTSIANKLKSSVPLNTDQALQIVGSYAGQIQFNDDRGRNPIEMFLSGSVAGSGFRGRSDIRILDKNGKQWSHGRGSGNLNKTYSVAEDAFLIEIGGDYLELYYFPAIDKLSGYYAEAVRGEFRRVGSITLDRR